MVLAWFSISVGLEVYGGDGKHLWDVTYHEYNRFDRVRTARPRKIAESVGHLINRDAAHIREYNPIPSQRDFDQNFHRSIQSTHHRINVQNLATNQ